MKPHTPGHHISQALGPLFFAAPALLALLAQAPVARAQPELITEDIVINANSNANVNGATVGYEVADGFTLTLQPAPGNTNRIWGNIGNSSEATVLLRPATPGGTGRIVIQNYNGSGQGGTLYIMGGGTFFGGNIDFVNNRTSAGTNAFGGAVAFAQGATGTLANVTFSGNSADVSGGAIEVRQNGASVTIINGVFSDNYVDYRDGSTTMLGGAVNNFNTSFLTMDGGAFLRNHSALNGGAIANTNQALVNLTNVTFSGNWAMNFGGAFFQTHANSLVTLNYTLAGGTSAYTSSGNIAGGLGAAAGMTAPAAKASAGGFWYSTANGNGGTLCLNVDAGVSVTIGDPSTTLAGADSFATDQTGGGLRKEGAGDLIIHSDGAYFRSNNIHITGGRFLLGNENARFGGAITVSPGATIGGSGTFMTLDFSDAPLASSVTAQAGSFIEVGISGAAPGTLAFTNLNFTDATLKFDLFGWDNASSGYVSDRLLVLGTLNASSSGTISITTFASGTYNLGNLGSIVSNLSAIVGSGGGARQGVSLAAAGADLLLIAVSDQSRNLLWTGAAEHVLGMSPGSWTDGAATPTVEFASGDKVAFDNTAPPASRAIAVAAGGVIASEMTVSGDDYVFGGAGGITTGTRYVEPAAIPLDTITADGRLHKTGAGTLTFANAGANNFEGGIEIGGGVLAFSRADQIGTQGDSGAGSGITFAGSGTLRALAAIPSDFNNNILIADAMTAALDTNGNNVTYSGVFSLAGAATSGTFAKLGAGMLTLSAAGNGSAGLVTEISAGTLRLDGGSLAGAANVRDGATLAGEGVVSGTLRLDTNAILDIGSTSAAPATLTTGGLSLDGATLMFDLFGWDAGSSSYVSDQLFVTGGIDLAGTGTLVISSFITGTHNLGNFGALANNLATVVHGAGVRQAASIYDDAGDLMLVTGADRSRHLLWTGAAAQAFDVSAGSWTDGATINPIDEFANGDKVTFDSAHAGAGSHVITVPGLGATVSEMVVGNGDFTFTGSGGITSAARFVNPAVNPAETLAADGKLHKTGAGTLTFANTGANNFEGGIEISGGVLAFGNVAQIGTTDNGGADHGITFADTGTLRANAALTLATGITIADGKTAALDTNGNTVAYSGAISLAGGATSGTLAKLGAGTLVYSAAGAPAAAFAIDVREDTLLLASGTLSGPVRVRSGATFGGAGAALGTGANSVFLDAGSTLQIQNSLGIASLAVQGDATLAGSGTLAGIATIAPGATATVLVDTGSLTLAGNFTGGAGTLEKTGGGALVLESGAGIAVDSIAINQGVFLMRANSSMTAASGVAIASASTLAAGASITAGSFALNAGTLTLEPDASLSANTIALNQGVLQMRNGASVTAASSFTIASGAALHASGAAAGTIHAASFVNAGAIRVGRASDPLAPFGTLAITGNSYTGDGGAVYLSGSFAGLGIGGAGAYDQLSLRDITISGTTTLFINITTPITLSQLLSMEPLDTTGATIDPGAVFAMSEADAIKTTTDKAYLWAYSLAEGGWYPVGAVSPVKAMLGADAVSLLMGLAALDSANNHITALRGIQHEPKARVWLNSLYRQDKLSSTLYDGASARTRGAQVGLDWGNARSGPGESLAIGVFYDYVSSSLEIPGRASSVDSKANSLGAYFAWEIGRLYAAGIFHRAFDMKHTMSAPGSGTASAKGRARAISLEAGFKIFDSPAWKAELYAQYANQSHSIYQCVDTEERMYQFKPVKSSLWRGGARLWRDFTLRSGAIIRPWLRASYACEQDATSDMTVLTLDNDLEWKFANDMGGSGAIAEAGVTLELGRRLLLSAGGSWHSVGKIKSHSLNLGANIAW